MVFRKKRMARIHLTQGEPSIEGVWMGRVGKHYRIAAARVIENEERSFDVSGEVLVPVERVAFVQVLS